MIRLSAVVITKNEEAYIGRCLDALADVADEILVVDSFSTDRTPEICKEKGVRFTQHPFEGHVAQKNKALELASSDYVLSVDADEVLDEKLKQAILQTKKNWQADGYFINRRNFYCDKPIRYGGWYPDRKLRMINKTKGRWTGRNPHDRLELTSGSSTAHLDGHLLHYTVDSIAAHVNQINYFSDIAAQSKFEAGEKTSLLKILIAPCFKFVKGYFLKAGLLDGYYGFVIALLSAYASFLRYAKLRELWKK